MVAVTLVVKTRTFCFWFVMSVNYRHFNRTDPSIIDLYPAAACIGTEELQAQSIFVGASDAFHYFARSGYRDSHPPEGFA